MLAGGGSRRLGGAPKGLEVVGGIRIIDRVAQALRAVASELVLATSDPAGASWLSDVTVLRDIHAGLGGLAGVEAGLSRGRDALVVAWDMPFVTVALLQLLLDTARATGVDVTLPASRSPYGFEPFCAVYAHRIGPRLCEFLDAGGGAAHDFLGTLHVHVVPIDALSRVCDVGRVFVSVNTPEDLERARALAASE